MLPPITIACPERVTACPIISSRPILWPRWLTTAATRSRMRVGCGQTRCLVLGPGTTLNRQSPCAQRVESIDRATIR